MWSIKLENIEDNGLIYIMIHMEEFFYRYYASYFKTTTTTTKKPYQKIFWKTNTSKIWILSGFFENALIDT